jgi:anhydro-N-acetylmuramic acid kinase
MGKIYTALGFMTGTSMDGVDLSLVRSDGNSKFTSILDDYYEFDQKLREKIVNLRNKIFTSEDLKKYSNELQVLERELTLFHCEIMKNLSKKNYDQIELIGFHGQTIFHDPKKKISKQLGDGMLLSQITKKLVINNFRENDLRNGGQGAPLTPIFHVLLFRLIKAKYKISYPINFINIGGISNITQITESNDTRDVNLYAFDIGPGNCLIDEWVRRNSNKKFDENGSIAKYGSVNDLIYNQAIDNFSKYSFKNSLDIKDFDSSFVRGLSLEDGCATLTKFSAYLIVQGIKYMNELNNTYPVINLICGGGRKNNSLIEEINFIFNNEKIKFENIDSYGFDGDFIESQAFGYLSIRTYLNLPISFPKTTRCKTDTIGGIINKNF